MAKAVKKKAAKKASKKRGSYEKPVTFAGSFEDMIKISTTGAGAKKSAKK